MRPLIYGVVLAATGCCIADGTSAQSIHGRSLLARALSRLDTTHSGDLSTRYECTFFERPDTAQQDSRRFRFVRIGKSVASFLYTTPHSIYWYDSGMYFHISKDDNTIWHEALTSSEVYPRYANQIARAAVLAGNGLKDMLDDASTSETDTIMLGKHTHSFCEGGLATEQDPESRVRHTIYLTDSAVLMGERTEVNMFGGTLMYAAFIESARYNQLSASDIRSAVAEERLLLAKCLGPPRVLIFHPKPDTSAPSPLRPAHR